MLQIKPVREGFEDMAFEVRNFPIIHVFAVRCVTHGMLPVIRTRAVARRHAVAVSPNSMHVGEKNIKIKAGCRRKSAWIKRMGQ